MHVCILAHTKPKAGSRKPKAVVVMVWWWQKAEGRSSDEEHDFTLNEKLCNKNQKGKQAGPVGNMATFLRRSRKRYKVLKAKKVVDEGTTQ